MHATLQSMHTAFGMSQQLNEANVKSLYIKKLLTINSYPPIAGLCRFTKELLQNVIFFKTQVCSLKQSFS